MPAAALTPHPDGLPVAVVDIGSNSIKVLVARRSPTGELLVLAHRTEDTRIGTGITEHPPRLHDDAIERGVTSVAMLLAEAARFSPGTVRIVATSAVRDATNRAEFISRLRAATGHEISVLTGHEEARLIGRGIVCDPAFHRTPAFYLFDLGGGSLEMLAYREGQLLQLTSLPLGCVRLTEACVADPTRAISSAEMAAIREHVRATVAASPFSFALPAPAAAAVTGGTATTCRLLEAAARSLPLAETNAALHLTELESLATRLCAATLAQRAAIPGMPANRADVLPAALLTLIEVARFAGVEVLRHSWFSLRYGLAAETLGIDSCG